MNAELKMTGVDYNLVSAIFFVTYCCFREYPFLMYRGATTDISEVPCNAIFQRYFINRPSIWITILTLSWGIIMTCHGFVKSTNGLLAVRILMGIPEAGFFPGAVLLVSTWYPRNMTGQRVSLFYVSSALAGAASGLLAFAIAKMNGIGGYAGWRWIFIMGERGLPAKDGE